MNLHWIDWTIFIVLIGGLTCLAYYCKRYNRGVADFLAANRCAGRYLLATGQGAAAIGAVSFVAYFEQHFEAGFAPKWWMMMMMPIGLLLSLFGWVIYRFRETRALTMAQFFEMRYSRKFRVFSGILCWVSGILNYGILPAIAARFVLYFFGFEIYTLDILGLEVNLTLAVIMAMMIGLALFFTFAGGQISVIITDFLQGWLFYIVFIGTSVFLIMKFGWGHIMEVLVAKAPEGKSMINPFAQGDVPDFNAMFFLMLTFITIYTYKAFQGQQGYNTSARTPHEAKMANVLMAFRLVISWLLYLVVPICAWVMFKSPEWTNEAAAVNAELAKISDEQIRIQMTTPLAMVELIPVGLFGLICAVIIAAAVSSDDTNLLSWGSIFVQDVLMVLRKEPLDHEQHMVWLHRSIWVVAIFAFFFGLLFPLKEYIIMWWVVSAAIYTGGAGAAIIGGLYWARGTAEGAWAGMISGSTLAVSGILIQNVLWPQFLPPLQERFPSFVWLHNLPEDFPLNGMQITFWSALIAIILYIVFSLLSKPDPNFSMDRMLHRGEYDETHEHREVKEKVGRFWKLIGVGPEFTRGDKAIYVFKILWIMIWFVSFVVGTVINLTTEVSNEAWVSWWTFYIIVMLAMSFITVVWFTFGGFRDMRDLFRLLKSKEFDSSDDGWVEKESSK